MAYFPQALNRASNKISIPKRPTEWVCVLISGYILETMYAHREVQAGPSFQTAESGRALDKFFLSVAVAVYIQSLFYSKLKHLESSGSSTQMAVADP